MPCYGNYNDGIMPFTKKIVNKNLSQTKQLPDSQRPDIAPVGRLFHCDVTIKWPVKWMRYCDVTIE